MTGTAVGLQPKLPRLPACRSCQSKKVKCDSKRPKCEPCNTSGTDCTIALPDGASSISREYIHDLEQRNQASAVSGQDASSEMIQTDSPVTITSNLQTTTTPAAHLAGGGISYLTALFADPEWRKNNADLKILAQAARPPEPDITPNTLPPLFEAKYLFSQYIDGSNIQHPFLLRSEVHDTFHRVFVRDGTPLAVSSNDLFRTFMILAVASVMPYRQGRHTAHPFGYYLAAMPHLNSSFLVGGLHAIQDLLLICRFGIYHHIGISVWETVRMCMRMCIELGLQRPQKVQTNLLDEQIRRRVFWSCYVMDRYSSYTLNRPFVIADTDVHVNVPAHADDEVIIAASSSFTDLDSFCLTHIPEIPNCMTAALYFIKLRQITSRIHSQTTQSLRKVTTASNSKIFLAPGKMYMMVQDLFRQLQDWRSSAPLFDHPLCLYQRSEFYDLLEAREKLLLVRKVVDLTPKRDGLPTEYVLSLCLQCAMKLILLYSDLFRRSLITHTRSYFHTLFTAGLSVLFCISVSTPSKTLSMRECLDALEQCEDTLKQMAAKLPDASPYATTFKALHKNVLRKLDMAPQSHPVTLEPIGSYEKTMYASQRSAGIVSDNALDAAQQFGQTVNNGQVIFGNPATATTLFDTGFAGSDSLPWMPVDYDALWNMGQFDYGEYYDTQGMFDGMSF